MHGSMISFKISWISKPQKFFSKLETKISIHETFPPQAICNIWYVYAFRNDSAMKLSFCFPFVFYKRSHNSFIISKYHLASYVILLQLFYKKGLPVYLKLQNFPENFPLHLRRQLKIKFCIRYMHNSMMNTIADGITYIDLFLQ